MSFLSPGALSASAFAVLVTGDIDPALLKGAFQPRS
jgi:hypothetical protein